MEQQTFDIKLEKEFSVAVGNDLIKGKQSMTPREAKLLAIAMAQVVNEDKDFKTYTTTLTDLAKFMEVTKPALSRDIEEICTSLVQRIVKVKTSNDKWSVFQWVNRADYDNGTLTLRLSNDIKPYMIALAEQGYFTKFNLGILLTFDSFYTTRLYQLLKCEVGLSDGRGGKDEWEFSIDELRDFFQTGKKYPAPKDLLKKTIETAIKELNASPYALIWDYEKIKAHTKGNPIKRVYFKALMFESQKHKDAWVIYQEEQAEQLRMDEVTADENN
jgi:plasmid replication initiation protein